jgi:hypothetical protein
MECAMKSERYMQMEGETLAIVDFLSEHVAVKVRLEDGVIQIEVRAMTTSGMWEDHDFTVVLPEYVGDDYDDDDDDDDIERCAHGIVASVACAYCEGEE